MNSKQMIVGLTMLLSFFLKTYSAIFTGNDLYVDYQAYKIVFEANTFNDSDTSAVMCSGHFLGFCAGVADSLDKIYFDIPEKVTLAQIAEIFGKYLETHPEARHQAAYRLCAASLSEAFPLIKKEDKNK